VPSRLGVGLAWLALLMAPLTVVGLFRLRTWSLLAAVVVPLLVLVLALEARRGALVLGHGPALGWLAGGWGTLLAAAPLMLVMALTLSFWRVLVRKAVDSRC
jgi:hypothetical protein